MVGVGVGDEDSVQVLEGYVKLKQSGANTAAGDSGVDEDVSSVPGKNQRVPRRTAGKRMYRGQSTLQKSKNLPFTRKPKSRMNQDPQAT